jgi:hypothetical protein
MKYNLLFYQKFMPYIPCTKSEFFVNHREGDFHKFFVIHVKGGFQKFFFKDNFF